MFVRYYPILQYVNPMEHNMLLFTSINAMQLTSVMGEHSLYSSDDYTLQAYLPQYFVNYLHVSRA